MSTKSVIKTCQENNIDYQNKVLFVAQDIDYITACMCYIQLCTLNCAGIVVIGDSLSNPIISDDYNPFVENKTHTVFYTPEYMSDKWLSKTKEKE